jgi:integrase
MTNSANTPMGKARKGQVMVRPDSGSVKACFPRTYFADGKQVKLATGINPDDWEAMANRLQKRLQLELEEGKLSVEGIFNLGRYQEILEEYGLRAKLRVVKGGLSDDQLPPRPQYSLMEIWEMYSQYIRPTLRESNYIQSIQGIFTNFIKDAIDAIKCEDAVRIRNWLIENRGGKAKKNVKNLLSHLEEAYKLAKKQQMVTHNPFEGMSDEIKKVGVQGKTQDDIEGDNDICNTNKAYTWDEAMIILNAINIDKFKYWYDYYKFKFLTGCRTGEAIGLRWKDVFFDKEFIVIRSAYSQVIGKFNPSKNGTERLFPMHKDDELWQLLKSIPQGEPKDVVFKSKTGAIINKITAHRFWHGSKEGRVEGLIPKLIKQGKLDRYLPPYNTRHTFISHQIYDLGTPPEIVNAWCEHSEDVSKKHYRDIGDRAIRYNPDLPANQQKMAAIEAKQKSQDELIVELKAEIERLKAEK